MTLSPWMWRAVTRVVAGALGCAGIKEVGGGLGLAEVLRLSDPRPGELWLGDEVEIGTSCLCEPPLTRAFPFQDAKLQDELYGFRAGLGVWKTSDSLVSQPYRTLSLLLSVLTTQPAHPTSHSWNSHVAWPPQQRAGESWGQSWGYLGTHLSNAVLCSLREEVQGSLPTWLPPQLTERRDVS